MTNGVSSLVDLTNALAPMNKDFFIRGFQIHFPIGLPLECFMGKSSFVASSLQMDYTLLTGKDQ